MKHVVDRHKCSKFGTAPSVHLRLTRVWERGVRAGFWVGNLGKYHSEE
jgi:hypothetical protein